MVNTYHQLKTFLEIKEYVEDVKVAVEVDEWFHSDDKEYNLDEISIEEFLTNVEYVSFIRHEQLNVLDTLQEQQVVILDPKGDFSFQYPNID